MSKLVLNNKETKRYLYKYRNFQMRLPYELLSSLANCLLNDMIFQIVIGLMEIQQVTEKHLYQQRQQVLNQHKRKIVLINNYLNDEVLLLKIIFLVDIHALIEQSTDEQTFSSQYAQILRKQSQEIKILDMNIVEQLDQKVRSLLLLYI